MQATVFMNISAHPCVDRVALERFVDFGVVGGDTQDEVVREESMFLVQVEEALQDIVNGYSVGSIKFHVKVVETYHYEWRPS